MRRAFTLIELLVVISIIALLIGILLPALGAARRSGMKIKCLTQIRSLEIAHWTYMQDHKVDPYGDLNDPHRETQFIKVGLPHGGTGGTGLNVKESWYYTLENYYGTTLNNRSPTDDSPWWPGGTKATNTKYRLTSYGVNNFFTPHIDASLASHVAVSLDQVKTPGSVVHFLYMAKDDASYATTDHVHVEQWPSNGVDEIPDFAASQVETGAYGGKPRSWVSVTNWGFLDGHAGTLAFNQVYAEDGSTNQFDPTIAH